MPSYFNDAVQDLRRWYFDAVWYEVYDVLEYSLQQRGDEARIKRANELLRDEGSGYRFVGEFIAPITNDAEVDFVNEAMRHSGPFRSASEHITQAISHLGSRTNPDYRNAIKEAISAVESAGQAATNSQSERFEKAVLQLGLHPQLSQAMLNLFRWASDERGVRHGMHAEPRVGFPEARMTVVVCSSLVNFLVNISSS